MAPASSADLNDTLAFAVIGVSQAPLLLLSEDLRVLTASTSFCRDYGVDCTAITGRSIFDLGAGEWDLPRFRSLLTAVASGDVDVDAYEIDFIDLKRRLRRLVLHIRRLEFAPGAAIRLMLTIVDVTDERADQKIREDLVREKDILLREVQHRVANSLQIIASVLLQNARKVQSDESRGHLQDAHQRVMSVAAVQRQLSESRLGDVLVRPYLDQLCRSLSASMINDDSKTRIDVTADGSATSASMSVSLGLITTELVINALKHAFPGDRDGVISVDYRSGFEGWTLSVCDDGVGMAQDVPRPKAGLGPLLSRRWPSSWRPRSQ